MEGRSASCTPWGRASKLVRAGMMGPNPEVWPMLGLSIGVAVVAAWIGDLVGHGSDPSEYRRGNLTR
jgi:hypothetical protein